LLQIDSVFGAKKLAKINLLCKNLLHIKPIQFL